VGKVVFGEVIAGLAEPSARVHEHGTVLDSLSDDLPAWPDFMPAWPKFSNQASLAKYCILIPDCLLIGQHGSDASPYWHLNVHCH
jgi:hypothetical protein